MLPTDSKSAASLEVEMLVPTTADGGWVTPQDFALFTAEFSREGADLLLRSDDGRTLLLSDYFNSDTPADVLSHDGASLAGPVVERLAGPLFPGQYAQSGGFALEDAIGQVETLTGAAFVQRTDGTTVELDVGIKVFQGDVVRTELGGTLGITFADGTIFTLASGSRMVLDELIYDPESTENSGVFSLVEGSFVFIAGQAAPTGGIQINTPSATMGIRGTTVKVDIQTADGVSTVKVSLNPDFDGGTGAIELFDLEGNLITTITSTDEQWIISPPSTDIPPIRIERSDIDLGDDAPLLAQAFAALQTALSRVEQGETFVELPVNEADVDDDTDQTEDGDDGDPLVVPPLDGTGDDGEPGESGGDETELNGEDDALPENDDAPPPEDDAELETEGAPTDTASTGNGAPQVTVTEIQSIEDTPFVGDLGVTDTNGDAVAVSLTQGAQNGQVVLFEDGTFTYTPDTNFEGVDSFVVTATDTGGAATESEITVVVDPVNDAPVVSASLSEGSTLEIGIDAETGGTPAVGAIGYSDVDEGPAPAVWTIAASPENTTALGSISIDAETGAWQYDLNQGAADPLAEGEQIVESFIATVTDAEGATDSSTVLVTVTGSNDGPVITSEAAQEALEEDIFGFTLEEGGGGMFESVEGEETDGPATGSVSGTFSFQDVDQGDTPGQWSVVSNPENATDFGAISIDPDTGFWVYTLNQTAADQLGNGDTATEVFAATVTDAFGATASQSITIVITGLNDAPTIEFSIEDIEATVFEDGYDGPTEGGEALRFAAADGSDADATGTLRYVDPDGVPGTAASWSISPDGPSFGTMTIDAETGVWHYFLDQDAAQGLTEGEERIETFTAVVTDSLGLSSSQVITITLVGSNDEAVIVATPDDLAGAVEEGGVATATGTLTFVDADAAPGDVASWSIAADGTSVGSMVIDPISGEWTYTLDEGLANSLGEGVQVTETYTATLTDAQGAEALQTITITITGENDAPQIISAVLDGTVREAGAGDIGIPTISGTLTAVDPDDDGTTPIWQIAADPSNGSSLGLMMIDGLTGEWTYVLNQGAADALNLGDSVIERYTATIEDTFGGSQDVTVEITIDGNSDAPVLSSTTRTLTEEAGSVSVDLSALATDVDAGQDGSTLTYQLLTPPTAGSARIEGTELIFELGTAFNGLIEGEAQDVILNFSATDADGVEVTNTVTFTIVGTNGAPVFSDGSANLTEGDPSVDINLANLADDPDAGEDGTTLEYSIANGPAQGSAIIMDSTLTFTPGSAFDDLAEGATRQVSVDLVATDGDGETATATVTITVTGTNNAPEIAVTSDISGAIEEPLAVNVGLPVVATGVMAYSDPDATTATSGTWAVTPRFPHWGRWKLTPHSVSGLTSWIKPLPTA